MGAEIVFVISKDGSDVQAEANGFIGGGCQKAIDRILGKMGTVQEEKKKAEFYQEVNPNPVVQEGL